MCVLLDDASDDDGEPRDSQTNSNDSADKYYG